VTMWGRAQCTARPPHAPPTAGAGRRRPRMESGACRQFIKCVVGDKPITVALGPRVLCLRRMFVAGGTAGAVARTVTAPADRLKLLFQVQVGSSHPTLP